MKKNILTLLIAFSSLTFAQVGIDTIQPTATLDVNGDMRVRTVNPVSSTDHVLSTDTDGYVHKIPVTELSSGTVNMESAMFVAGVSDISSNTPVLDLWIEQDTNGVEAIKRYYLLGQNVSVTLPKNLSKEGDETVRVITFISVVNTEFGGAALTPWGMAFQTKLYQENTNDFNGTNGGVFLYDSYFGGSDLATGSSASSTVGNGYRRRIDLSGENAIRDREINFYDFGGKWIMTVND